MIVGGDFTLTLSPRSLSSRLRRRRGQRVALLPQLADDGRERRRIDLRARVGRGARVSCMYTRTAGRTPWSQSRVRTSSAGRPRSASRRSDISCTAAMGWALNGRRRARTHHREWLLAGLHLRLHLASWTVTLVCCKQRCE